MKNKKLHYAWIVAIGCGLIMLVGVGFAANLFTIFLSSLQERLSLTKTQGSSLVSLQNFAGMASMYVFGLLYSKHSIRRLVCLCDVLIAFGFLLYAHAGTLAACYPAAICLGVGYGGGSMVPASILAARWFSKNRGTAIAISSCGSALANVIFPPILTYLIENVSPASAFVMAGGLALVLGLVTFLLVRDYPAEKGLQPLGAEEALPTDAESSRNTSAQKKAGPSAESIRLPRTRDFGIFLICCVLLGMIITPLLNYITPYLTSEGFEPMFASMVISVYGAIMFFSKPLYGQIADRFGGFKANFYILFLMLLGVLSFPLGGFHHRLAILIPVLIGLGLPVSSIGLPLWCVDLFGTESYARVLSFSKLVVTLGATIGAMIFGVVYDHTGSYRPAYLIQAVFVILLLILLQILYLRKAGREAGTVPAQG